MPKPWQQDEEDRRTEHESIRRVGAHILTKIREFRHHHPQYAHLSDDEILEMLGTDSDL